MSTGIPNEAVHDERQLANDVTGKGHRGTGPTVVGLDEDTDFAYVIGQIRRTPRQFIVAGLRRTVGGPMFDLRQGSARRYRVAWPV
ncbi:MAG: hypothetical protein BGO26_05185 [Actinobacteria bacterium 69-20]|jgi:hypothetical protein|nr:hypothetical protein [Actinomycetota bacterium]OJV25148.1 MAG: hypothetical protein BGO26_05185 [Actinobacteria bacterium 69-20]